MCCDKANSVAAEKMTHTDGEDSLLRFCSALHCKLIMHWSCLESEWDVLGQNLDLIRDQEKKVCRYPLRRIGWLSRFILIVIRN